MKLIPAKYTIQIRLALISFVIFLTGAASLLPAVNVAADCSALPTDKGTATATVTIPTDGTYRVWSRIMAPDTTNNSYLLQIDQTTCGVDVGDSASIPANTWTWVDYSDGNTATKINATLTAGTHTVTMAGREAGVKIDRVELTTDMNCVPQVNTTGDNCATVPVACASTPSAPTGLQSSATTTTGTSLSWTASTPGPGCTLSGYQVYRGATKVADLSAGTTNFTDTGLTASTAYSYTVTATDTASHVSTASSALTVTTSANPVTTPVAVPGDTNGDGVVNTLDIANLVKHWGQHVTPGTDGDLSGNGIVDPIDIATLVKYWPR